LLILSTKANIIKQDKISAIEIFFLYASAVLYLIQSQTKLTFDNLTRIIMLGN